MGNEYKSTQEQQMKITMDSKVRYRKRTEQQMIPWTPETPMDLVSVSEADKANGSPKVGDMIAINPKDEGDMWLVAEKFLKENYDLVPDESDTTTFKDLHDKATKNIDFWQAKCEELEDVIADRNAKIAELEAEVEWRKAVCEQPIDMALRDMKDERDDARKEIKRLRDAGTTISLVCHAIDNLWGHHDDGSELMVNTSELFNILYNDVLKTLRKVVEKLNTTNEVVCSTCGVAKPDGSACKLQWAKLDALDNK